MAQTDRPVTATTINRKADELSRDLRRLHNLDAYAIARTGVDRDSEQGKAHRSLRSLRADLDAFFSHNLHGPRPDVAVGDRVRDPMDGQWRTVARLPQGAGDTTVHMTDGGVMCITECTDIRLPSEPLDDGMTQAEYDERMDKLHDLHGKRAHAHELAGNDSTLADEWLSRQVDRLDAHFTGEPGITARYDAAVLAEDDQGGEIGVDI